MFLWKKLILNWDIGTVSIRNFDIWTLMFTIIEGRAKTSPLLHKEKIKSHRIGRPILITENNLKDFLKESLG